MTLPVAIRPRITRSSTSSAKLLGMSTKPRTLHAIRSTGSNGADRRTTPRLAAIPCLVAESVAQSPYANVTIKTNVST